MAVVIGVGSMALRIGLEQIGAEIVLLGAKDFAGVVRSTEKDIDRLNDKVKQLDREGSSAFANLAKVATASLGAVGIATGLIASATSAIGGASIIAASDYEQSLKNIQAITFDTQANISALDDKIGELASNTRVNMHNAAEAATELARGGVDATEAVAGALEAVLNLSIASAGELGLERSAVLVATTLKAFDLQASESASVVNALTTAAQNSAITFVDLQRSFQQAAPSAALFGLSVGDLAATLGVMGQQGIRGSDAGTSLKQAFQQLVNPSKQALAVMKEYGISLFDTTGAVRPFRDFIADLEKNFGDTAIAEGKLTEAQRANALATIGGSDAVRALIILSQRGVAAFDDFKNGIGDATTSAEQMAKLMQSTLNAQVQILLNNIGILSTRFGAAFIPVLKEATAATILFARSLIPIVTLVGTGIGAALQGLTLPTDFQEKLNNLVSPEASAGINGLIDTLRTVKDVTETIVLPALGQLGESFNRVFGQAFDAAFITQAFKDIAASIVTIGSVVSVAATAMASFFDNIKNANEFRNVLFAIASVPLISAALGIGAIAATIVAAVGPTIALAAAIAAVVLAVVQLAGIGASVAQVATDIEAVGPEIETALLNPFENAALEIPGVLEAIDASIISENIRQDSTDVVAAIVEPFDAAVTQIGDIVDNIDFKPTISGVVGDVLPDPAEVQARADAMITSFSLIEESGKKTDKALDSAFANIKNAIGGFVEDSFKNLKFLNDAFVTSFGSMLQIVGNVVGGLISAVVEFGGNLIYLIKVMNFMDESTIQMAKQVLKSLEGISTGLDFLLGGAQTFLNGWSQLWSSAGQIVSGAVNFIIGNINSILTALGAIPGIGALGTVANVTIGGGFASAPAQIERIGSKFSELGTNVRNTLDSITKRADEFTIKLEGLGGAGESLRERLAKLGTGAGTVGGAFDQLADKAGGAGKKAKKAGEDVQSAIDGFLDAIAKADRLQSFVDAFGSVGAKAADALVEAVVSNVGKDGAKAAETLHDLVQELRKANIPEWEELGGALTSSFARAQLERSDEAIAAAISVIQLAADAMKAQGRLTQDTFANAFNLAQTTNQLGSQGAALVKGLTDSIAKGTTDLVKEVGKTTQALLGGFVNDLPSQEAARFGALIVDSIKTAIEERTPEAVTALSNLIQQLNFEGAIIKAGTARANAINKATEDTQVAIEKLKTESAKELANFESEAEIKGILEANIEFRKDYYDKLIRITQEGFDAEKKARDRAREDTANDLSRSREDEQRDIDRKQALADARKKAADKLAQGGVKQLSKIGDMTIGIVGSNAADSEVEALKKRWAIEDARQKTKRTQEDTDRALKRQQQDEDQTTQTANALAITELKKTSENAIQVLKDREENRQHALRITQIREREQTAIDEANRRLTEVTGNEDTKFNETYQKLLDQKALADTVMDGLLEDLNQVPVVISGWVQQMKGLGGIVTITFDNKSTQPVSDVVTATNADGSQGQQVGIQTVPEFAKGGFIPGAGTRLIRAHGGEYVMNLAQVSMFERMFRQQQSTGSEINRSTTYQVNASYSQYESPASITDDMRALVALTS